MGISTQCVCCCGAFGLGLFCFCFCFISHYFRFALFLSRCVRLCVCYVCMWVCVCGWTPSALPIHITKASTATDLKYFSFRSCCCCCCCSFLAISLMLLLSSICLFANKLCCWWLFRMGISRAAKQRALCAYASVCVCARASQCVLYLISLWIYDLVVFACNSMSISVSLLLSRL